MAGSQDDIPPPPPPPSQTPTQQTPHTVSTIKLPILKKGEYDIWAMKMEHYLAHTDYPIWEVIQNGNGPVSISTDTQGQIKVLPPRTAEEILARERERKARTTLLMALPEDHLAKFHKMTDAKEMWEAIKSRFGGNDESKKMQKYILKQQFEGFSVSNSEGLHKGYDRFQSLLSQLEIHGAGVSTEDANQKFFRVFENDVKGSTASSSSTQNVAFVSENTSSTNDVSTAYGVCPQLDHEDLEQLDEFDLEEMDLKWQVALISMRMKKFYKKTGRKLQFDAKEPVGFDKTKVECYSYHKTGHFARDCRTKGNQDSRRRDAWNSGNKDGRRSGKQEDSKSLVTIDGEGVDWTSHLEEEEDYALMACNSSGSDTEVTSCSKECKESYAKHKKLYDEQRAQLSDANIEILAYTQALKKVEAQLVAHQQSQLWYEEKIRFMKIDLDDKTDVLTYHKKMLLEAEKEKEYLKAKVEKWHNSSKNLGKLVNTQMSANDKFGLGYGGYRYDGILSYKNEVLQSVFMNKESNLENQPLYDRFVTAEGMHVAQASESKTQTSDFDTCDSNCSDETHESLPEPAVNEPKVVSQPKVWSDAPIIEEYESDSEDEHVSLPTEEQETPSFANKQVKTPRETVKNQFTHSKNPKVDKKGLGYGFTTKACFVCGSLSHLIRDCDFHEKRMAKQAELNNRMRKKSSQREIRPIWNNVQRMNHRNQFVPKAVLTRTGKIPVNTARASGTNTVNTARHNVNRQAVPTNAANIVNTVKPIVNNARPKSDFHKSVSPFRKSLNRTTTLRTNFSYQKVNTAEVNAVSAVGGKRETAVKPSAGCNWRPKRHYWHKDYPHRALQNKGIVDSGCSRHMTGNKAYLAEYQDFNGGPVAFGGSKGYITGKGKIKTGKLDFEDVCFVKELQHFNLFSVSQMCDKKNKVLFTDTECLVLSPEFKLPDENQVLLRIPRQNNMYSFNLENIVPSGGLACLIAKATIDESNKWHRRLGHVNFKNLNKLVKGNLVRGLPSKIFQNDHTCVACQKGKQHKASCKAKTVSSISQPLQLLHMDLFGPTSVRSLNHKTYCLVITDDFSRIEAIRIFLAFASYMGLIVYQMDVKSAFLYGKIDEELSMFTPSPSSLYATLSTFLLKSGYRRGTIDKTLFIKKDKNDIMLVQVYVDDIIFGSTKKSWCDEFEVLMKSRFQMSSMGELTFFLGLQVKQKEDGIFISQDKYVAEILKKFDFASVKTASTPIETQKPLVKDEEASDVDVHLYRSMIGSLMYLTASRPDIMFAVCACSRFQVTPKTSHLNVVKRIFRRLISGKCKKQTIVATSTTEAEYVAAANCCGQVLWIQNQIIQYITPKQSILQLGTTSLGAYEKKLIQVLKIHTDDNVADLLTKAFDVSRFQFLVVTIGMVNP
ncbi:putative ribonuclease H-like domain-containing protein [Tanacetum coccineum]